MKMNYSTVLVQIHPKFSGKKYLCLSHHIPVDPSRIHANINPSTNIFRIAVCILSNNEQKNQNLKTLFHKILSQNYFL